MDSINDRFTTFFNSLNVKKLQFDNRVGLARGLTGKILAGTGLSSDSAAKIFAHYPDLNANWLFKGDGSMYHKAQEEVMMASEPPAQYGRNDLPLVVTVDNHGKENILMVGSRAYAGYTSNITEPEYLRQLPAFGLPLPEFRNKTMRAFQAGGQSMEPSIYNGDWLIAQYVDDWPRNIKDGYIYIIVTNETILVKRILNRLSQGKLIIQSDNESYPTDYIHPEDVKELWYLKAKISFQFPNTRFEVLKEISNLKADIELLKGQILRT